MISLSKNDFINFVAKKLLFAWEIFMSSLSPERWTNSIGSLRDFADGDGLVTHGRQAGTPFAIKGAAGNHVCPLLSYGVGCLGWGGG
jgi:hypothetical protein